MAEILRWDTARYLNTEEDIEGYLDIIYEDGDLIALGEWNAERARRRLLRQQKHRDRCDRVSDKKKMQTLDKHNAKGNQGENERSQSYFAGILDQIDKRFSDFRSEMNTRFSDFR